MNQTTTTRRAPLAALALVALLALAACTPTINWTYDKSFGTVIEPTSARASLDIYREPRLLLHKVYVGGGIRPVQDIIWAVGRGPLAKIPSLCVAGLCVNVVADAAHSLIYDRGPDLASALADATTNFDCLALTLISYGNWEPNWTHKSVGCQIGSL